MVKHRVTTARSGPSRVARYIDRPPVARGRWCGGFAKHAECAWSNNERNIVGAWDHTTFGNDDACDWGGDLRSCEDLSFVEETLDKVIDAGQEYLEAPVSSQAIAAAEVVARLQGHFGVRNAYTESVDKWVGDHPQTVPAALAEKARVALERILTRPSELLELWQESEHFESWKGTITELKSRIEI